MENTKRAMLNGEVTATWDLMTITPEMAKQWLNPQNRKINISTVKRYAADMENGNWKISPHGIVLCGGRCVDGNHRLSAIIMCKQPVNMLVMKSWPHMESPMSLPVDRGASRKACDVLGMNPRLTSIVSKLGYIVKGRQMTDAEIFSLYNAIREMCGGSTFETDDGDACVDHKIDIFEIFSGCFASSKRSSVKGASSAPVAAGFLMAAILAALDSKKKNTFAEIRNMAVQYSALVLNDNRRCDSMIALGSFLSSNRLPTPTSRMYAAALCATVQNLKVVRRDMIYNFSDGKPEILRELVFLPYHTGEWPNARIIGSHVAGIVDRLVERSRHIRALGATLENP